MTSPASPMIAQIATMTGAQAPGKTSDLNRAKEQAREFESVFLSTVLAQMFATLEEGNGPLGAAGTGGETWRSFLTDEYAQEISRAGGIGIADQILRELISVQEQTQ